VHGIVRTVSKRTYKIQWFHERATHLHDLPGPRLYSLRGHEFSYDSERGFSRPPAQSRRGMGIGAANT
jgi:hypothetical protein